MARVGIEGGRLMKLIFVVSSSKQILWLQIQAKTQRGASMVGKTKVEPNYSEPPKMQLWTCRRAVETCHETFLYALGSMPCPLNDSCCHCMPGMARIFFWMVPETPTRKAGWLLTSQQERLGCRPTPVITFSEDMPVAGQFACPPPIRWLQSIMQLLSTTWAEERKANPSKTAKNSSRLNQTHWPQIFFRTSGALSVSFDILQHSAIY